MSNEALERAKNVAKQIQELKTTHFDVDNNCWKGSQTFVDQLKEKVRLLRFSLQIDSDTEALGNPSTPWRERLTLIALTSRRTNIDLWPLINKTKQDGLLFTFREPNSFMVCDCDDDVLTNDAYLLSKTKDNNLEDRDTLELVRNEHNKLIFESKEQSSICQKQRRVTERVTTHVIGNTACQACVAVVEDMAATDQDDPLAILATKKFLDLCPRFMSVLRTLDMPSYIRTLLNAEATANPCFAGLLHSEMHFDEYLEYNGNLYPKTDKTINLSDEQLASDDVKKQKVVVITYMCDTCGFVKTKIERYNEPAPVTEGELLL